MDNGQWTINLPAMSTQAPQAVITHAPRKTRVAVAAARFNADLTDELLAGCLRRLQQLGVADDHVEVVRVPGAFELPVAAKAFARTGRFDAVVCLGAVVRGDTPHFDYVAGECARGLQDVSIWEDLPVIFGVLTTNTHEQAVERTGGAHGHAGERAAEAAVEMITVLNQIADAGKKKSKAR
jgi:6,7-dimethyl-8-ribityllumazine synthase